MTAICGRCKVHCGQGGDRQRGSHSLRHIFATDILNKVKNIRKVQKALCHAKITTIEIYTHITDEDLENDIANLREDVV